MIGFGQEVIEIRYESGALKYKYEVKYEYSESGNKFDYPHGEYFEYFENGNIKSKGIKKNSLQDGYWIFYNEDGTVFEKKKY